RSAGPEVVAPLEQAVISRTATAVSAVRKTSPVARNGRHFCARAHGTTRAARHRDPLAQSSACFTLIANQASAGDVTNTIGSRHGRGSCTVASISALPWGLAGNSPVLTLTGLPLASRQLTTALKLATGLVSLRLGGTGGVLARTRPLTSTSTFPAESTSPSPLVMTQGKPPPCSPRTGVPFAPTNWPETPTMLSNSRIVFSLELAPAWTTGEKPSMSIRAAAPSAYREILALFTMTLLSELSSASCRVLSAAAGRCGDSGSTMTAPNDSVEFAVRYAPWPLAA